MCAPFYISNIVNGISSELGKLLKDLLISQQAVVQIVVQSYPFFSLSLHKTIVECTRFPLFILSTIQNRPAGKHQRSRLEYTHNSFFLPLSFYSKENLQVSIPPLFIPARISDSFVRQAEGKLPWQVSFMCVDPLRAGVQVPGRSEFVLIKSPRNSIITTSFGV